MEASAVYKLFCHVSRKNKLFVKKFDDSRRLFTCDKWIFNSRYGDVFISFSNQLFVYLEKYVKKDNSLLVNDILMDRLYHLVLPFRVWNYLFLCERLNSIESTCGYCVKLFIKNKEISDHVSNNMFVHVSDFPNQFKQEFILTQKYLYLYLQILL